MPNRLRGSDGQRKTRPAVLRSSLPAVRDCVLDLKDSGHFTGRVGNGYCDFFIDEMSWKRKACQEHHLKPINIHKPYIILPIGHLEIIWIAKPVKLPQTQLMRGGLKSSPLVVHITEQAQWSLLILFGGRIYSHNEL